MITLALPLPPTVNHYYMRGHRGQLYLSERVVNFRLAVLREVYKTNPRRPLLGRLGLFVEVRCSTKREQDIDNRLKGLQDALQYANLFLNDSQIDIVTVWRGPVTRPAGGCTVTVCEFEQSRGMHGPSPKATPSRGS